MNAHLNRRRKKIMGIKANNQAIKLEREISTKSYRSIDLQNYRCPCCGKIMKPEKANYENQNDIHYLICNECNYRGKARKELNGNYVLVSVPADKITRELRKEAHFYFDRLYKDNIFKSREEAYFWLTDQLPIASIGDCKHIGEFSAGTLKNVIEICVHCLIQNQHRLSEPLEAYQNFYHNSYTETAHLFNQT